MPGGDCPAVPSRLTAMELVQRLFSRDSSLDLALLYVRCAPAGRVDCFYAADAEAGGASPPLGFLALSDVVELEELEDADDEDAAEIAELLATTLGDSPYVDEAAAATTAELDELETELCLARPEELTQLAQMRAALREGEPAVSTSSREVLAQPDVFGDLRLLRFLRAYSHDIPQATAAYRSMVAWRREAAIDDTVRQHILGKELGEAAMPHAEKVTELGMVGALNAGFSRKGQHVNIAIDGAGDPTKLLLGTSEDEIRAFFRSFFELRALTCDAESRRRRRVVRSLTIRDLDNVGMHLVKHTKAVMILKRILGEALANYPESTSQVFFLNTPVMMSALWSIIKPMLSERSQAKCEFVGGEREYRHILVGRAGMPLAAIATLYEFNGAGHTAASLATGSMGPWAVRCSVCVCV